MSGADRPPRIRSSPEDFVVDEVPLYPPSGEGGHTFVRVEKRLRNSDDVARDLARAAGVAPRDVGYAGRKDRAAVTRQWFSVPGLDPDAARALTLPGAAVLEASRHGHKLRTGQLRGNRFEIVVRDVSPAQAQAACEAAGEIQRRGLPNRFGAQRFGRDGDNAERGAAILRGEGRRIDRRGARFLVSALQAAVFNAVLDARRHAFDEVERGDVAVVHASGGLFLVEDAGVESERAARFEISATGPIFGTRAKQPEARVAEREAQALLSHGVAPPEDWRLPRGLRLAGSRRPLRVRPERFELDARDDCLHVACVLPAGSFASVLLEEILGVAPLEPRSPARTG